MCKVLGDGKNTRFWINNESNTHHDIENVNGKQINYKTHPFNHNHKDGVYP